jgi:hypothetical protein
VGNYLSHSPLSFSPKQSYSCTHRCAVITPTKPLFFPCFLQPIHETNNNAKIKEKEKKCDDMLATQLKQTKKERKEKCHTLSQLTTSDSYTPWTLQ